MPPPPPHFVHTWLMDRSQHVRVPAVVNICWSRHNTGYHVAPLRVVEACERSKNISND